MKKLISFLKNPWFTRVYMATLLFWVSGLIYSQGKIFQSTIKTTRVDMLLYSIAAYFIVIGLINPFLHSIAYKEIGSNVTFWQAFRIFHLSRIGNYLPGRLWFATNYFIFSKKLNIDKEKIAKNFVMLNALLFLVGGICSLPIISFFNHSIKILILIFPFIMAIIVHPKFFNTIYGTIFEKNDTARSFRYIFLAKISLLYFAAYILLGFSLYFCTMSFIHINFSYFPQITAAVAASLIIGMLAIFAPAGLGVTESISGFILSQFISMEIAVMVVVALRLLFIVVDFSCALISALSITIEEKALAHHNLPPRVAVVLDDHNCTKENLR